MSRAAIVFRKKFYCFKEPNTKTVNIFKLEKNWLSNYCQPVTIQSQSAFLIWMKKTWNMFVEKRSPNNLGPILVREIGLWEWT